MPVKRPVVKPTPQQAAARQKYHDIPKGAKKDEPDRRYTKIPHEYGDILLAGRKLSALQQMIVYWIMRQTWGEEERPAYARLSFGAIAKLCDSDRKNVVVAMLDLERRGIIESRDRKGCGPTTVKMYRLTPDKWKAAKAYTPPAVKDEADDDEEPAESSPEIPVPAAPLPEAETAVDPGRTSKPQPVPLQVSKDAPPVVVRIVYHSEGFPFPVTFRTRPGRNGRLQVTARADEEKANRWWQIHHQFSAVCSPTETQQIQQDQRYLDFYAVCSPVCLRFWAKDADSELVKAVIAAAKDATAEEFAQIVSHRLKAPDSGKRHTSGILIELAKDAARAHTTAEILRNRHDARTRPTPFPPLTQEQIEESTRQADAEEKATRCPACQGNGRTKRAGVEYKCQPCKGTGRKKPE